MATMACLISNAARATPLVIDFEDVALSPNTFFYGGPGTLPDTEPEQVTLTSGSISFLSTVTRYSPAEFWSGFAFSNRGDTTTNSWTNDTSSFSGGGAGGAGNFAVAYWQNYDPAPRIVLPEGLRPESVKLVNTTYTALTIRDGDLNNFSAKKYGPEDFLSVTFTGNSRADGLGAMTGTATFFLADFRSGSNLVVDSWTDFSLASLGQARSIVIDFASSDAGEWGINTPTYVALDDLTLVAVPEPSGVVLAACGAATWIAWRRRARAG